MTFEQVVQECAANGELVAEFNRLTGCNFGKSLKRHPIEVMVDEATGFCPESEEDVCTFIAFVYDCVWLRLVP